MAKGEDALDVLRSIDATLKALLALAQQRATKTTTKAVAADRDLDSKWGDPELKFNPRDWSGPSFKGRHFSECPPELLDLVAETFDYFAKQADEKHEMTDNGKPVADYKRLDASRARGWAQRMRSGKHKPPLSQGNGNNQAPHWAEGDGF